MKILVTGGAGYIGSNLIPALLESGHNVTVLDNFRWGANSLAACCHHEGFQAIRADARDEAALKEAIRSADVIIPLAAMVGAPLCKQDPIGATTTNRDAILTLLKLASSQQRFLYPNTNSGYGLGQGEAQCTEASPLKPISVYGTTKCEAEDAILQRGNAVTFRLATVFGVAPRMRIDLLVNDFVHRAVTDRFVVLFESHFKRNYLHNRDVSGVFLHAINHFENVKNTTYNVGLSDANLSKAELCQIIQKYVPEFVYFESEIGEDPDKRNYIVSNEKIEKTGWKPNWTLDQGIRELIKQYRMINTRLYSNV